MNWQYKFLWKLSCPLFTYRFLFFLFLPTFFRDQLKFDLDILLKFFCKICIVILSQQKKSLFVKKWCYQIYPEFVKKNCMLPLFRTEGLTLTWFLSIFGVEVCDSVRLVMGLGILTLSMSFLTVDWRRHGNEDWILDILSFMPYIHLKMFWSMKSCWKNCIVLEYVVYMCIYTYFILKLKRLKLGQST